MRIVSNLNLINYNSYRIYSIASKAFFPETETDLLELLSRNDRFIIIGGGYNIILSKKRYEENIIILKDNFASFQIQNNILKAKAGCDLKQLCIATYENALSGLELFYDIPGSLGGAVVMNAGAKGESIGDLIQEIRVFDREEKVIKKMFPEILGFSYRNSIFQTNEKYLILEATLKLSRLKKKDIIHKIGENIILRDKKQPKGYPNAGSVFKRPSNAYVGPMIEELGLKGYQIGGAMISKKHAGFIVNYTGDAEASDIIKLIKIIQSKVKERYNLVLEIEQKII